MLKLKDNPPMVWPDGKSVEELEGRWWVAHTRSRNEKALAQELKGKDISYFLPMSWKVRSSRGRKIRSLLPVFSGYLFFCGGEESRLGVLKTNRVANILKVDDHEQLVCELSAIERALRSGSVLRPHKYISKGQQCRVTGGPLVDVRGYVVETKGEARLVLQVDMLGQAASVEVDMDLIEVID